jgi:hypothetical protein
VLKDSKAKTNISPEPISKSYIATFIAWWKCNPLIFGWLLQTLNFTSRINFSSRSDPLAESNTSIGCRSSLVHAEVRTVCFADLGKLNLPMANRF